jgi:hypothetical protein
MNMSNLLKRYVKLMLETDSARVPQQLVSSETDGQSGNSDSGEEAEDVNEFSGAGGAAGYTLPLGMDPDAAGRKKNSSR